MVSRRWIRRNTLEGVSLVGAFAVSDEICHRTTRGARGVRIS
jgi:hypothetical protein